MRVMIDSPVAFWSAAIAVVLLAFLAITRPHSAFLIGLAVVVVSFPFSVAWLAAFHLLIALNPHLGGMGQVFLMALGVATLLHFGVFAGIAWLVYRASRRWAGDAKTVAIAAFLYAVAVFIIFSLIPSKTL